MSQVIRPIAPVANQFNKVVAPIASPVGNFTKPMLYSAGTMAGGALGFAGNAVTQIPNVTQQGINTIKDIPSDLLGGATKPLGDLFGSMILPLAIGGGIVVVILLLK